MKRSTRKADHYLFQAPMWKHKGPASWCFVTLPINLSKQIRQAHSSSEEGWGRLKAKVTIGDSTWDTAIWFDTKAKAYLLPIKAVIRKKEKLEIKMMVAAKVQIERDPWAI